VTTGVAASPIGSIRRCSLRAGQRQTSGRRIGTGAAGRQPHWPAFTGDYAGDLLYATLSQFGFSRETIGRTPATVLSWLMPASPMR